MSREKHEIIRHWPATQMQGYAAREFCFVRGELVLVHGAFPNPMRRFSAGAPSPCKTSLLITQGPSEKDDPQRCRRQQHPAPGRA